MRFLLSFILLCAIAAPAQTSRQIDAIFSDIGPREPGAAVLVLRDGHKVFERGYGVADLRTNTPITSHTNFRLASCTKQFTAMTIMLLVHDGKLRYDEPLTEALPGFPPYGRAITIRHLLTHTSGLVAYEDIMDKQYGNTPDEQIPQIHDAGVLQLLEHETAGKFPPGSAWEYSNSGYATLAMVAEKASGKPFGDLLRDRIFRPLGMSHTLAYEKGKNEVPNRAYGHSRDRSAGASAWRETDQSSTSAVLGDGGIYSSLEDLRKWVTALDRYRLLSAEEMRPAYTAASVPPPAGGAKPYPAYGFGWFLDPWKDHRRISHDGTTRGFRTTIQRLPDDHLTVIILSNRADFDPIQRAEKIFDALLTRSVLR